MKIVNEHLAVKATLVAPNGSGYLMVAGEVGRWLGPFPLPDRRRTHLIGRLTTAARRLLARPEVTEATVFRGRLRPPGEGAELLKERGVDPARYDVVVLIRTNDPDSAEALRTEPVYRDLVEAITAVARRTREVVARNGYRIAEVDHRPDHPFLFNYFYGDDTKTLLRVWEYTAGWFQANTDLPNSVLMEPTGDGSDDHGIINHASWPTFRAFLPDLILRPTFRRFVLANFKVNGIAAQPIIYRRV